MRAYQCSRCTRLEDADEFCLCMAHIDPRPKHREKGDAKICRENFEKLPENEIWHEKFSWEEK